MTFSFNDAVTAPAAAHNTIKSNKSETADRVIRLPKCIAYRYEYETILKHTYLFVSVSV